MRKALIIWIFLGYLFGIYSSLQQALPFLKIPTLSQPLIDSSPVIDKSCTDQQNQMMLAVVEACDDQTDNIDDTSDCIWSLTKSTFNWYWNVYVYQQPKQDAITYWHFNLCEIKLSKHGVNAFSYLLWTAMDYQSSQDIGNWNGEIPQLRWERNIYQQENKSQTITLKGNPNAECDSWRISTVRNAYVYCDLREFQDSADCIQKRVKNQVNEYWGVYVGNTNADQITGLTVWNYDSCVDEVINYGTQKKHIFMWKSWNFF